MWRAYFESNHNSLSPSRQKLGRLCILAKRHLGHIFSQPNVWGFIFWENVWKKSSKLEFFRIEVEVILKKYEILYLIWKNALIYRWFGNICHYFFVQLLIQFDFPIFESSSFIMKMFIFPYCDQYNNCRNAR